MNFESNSENSIIVKEKITIRENKYRVFLQWNITHVVSENKVLPIRKYNRTNSHLELQNETKIT